MAKARLANIKTQLKIIQEAQETFYLANNSYTNALDQLDIHINCPKISYDTFTCDSYFINDPLEDNNKYNLIAYYCPTEARQKTYEAQQKCYQTRDFVYKVWFDHSTKPGQIECIANTKLGRAVCAEYN